MKNIVIKDGLQNMDFEKITKIPSLHQKSYTFFLEQACEIELLKVLNGSLFHLQLVKSLYLEHAEMAISSHLEPSSENFTSPAEDKCIVFR